MELQAMPLLLLLAIFGTVYGWSASMSACSLKPEPGPCRGSFPRYYFDGKKCEAFTYGGCKGNANNFKTLEACQRACARGVICSLPKVPGPCEALMKRFYFDGSKCTQFIYGGCEGNRNNFKTLAECQDMCQLPVCDQPVKPGPCLPISPIPRWGYKSDKRRCTKFYYGGCLGNQNNFVTKAACIAKCCPKRPPCFQSIKPGPCRGSFTRWGYDVNTRKCVKFVYGGCQGNDNRFDSRKACKRACRRVRSRAHCYQDITPGRCKATFPRWGYEPCSNTCVKFIYGGCGGNRNRFRTRHACQRRCRNPF